VTRAIAPAKDWQPAVSLGRSPSLGAGERELHLTLAAAVVGRNLVDRALGTGRLSRGAREELVRRFRFLLLHGFPMPPPFKPPASDSLATVDVAQGVSYEDECQVVEGVVSPRGQSGWPGRHSGYDVHCFSFANWRLPGGSLVGRELTLLRPVPPSRSGESRSENIFETFPAYSIQRFSVLLSKDHGRAVVEVVLAAEPVDETLRQFSEQLREPVVVSTARFGDLVMNPLLSWFEGKARWNRKDVELHLEPGEDGSIADAIKTADSLWADQAAWKRKVEEFAVDRLLPLKNDSWLGEGERELTAADFKKRMTLQSINVAGDGWFEFWHDDGDLFGGHAIQVSGTLKDGPTDADIPG
jgi:hypothetical protein